MCIDDSLLFNLSLKFLCLPPPSLPPPSLLQQVHPKHVKEAFRLLNKSIIRVETPDIDFEEPEEQDVINGKGGGGGELSHYT